MSTYKSAQNQMGNDFFFVARHKILSRAYRNIYFETKLLKKFSVNFKKKVKKVSLNKLVQLEYTNGITKPFHDFTLNDMKRMNRALFSFFMEDHNAKINLTFVSEL